MSAFIEASMLQHMQVLHRGRVSVAQRWISEAAVTRGAGCRDPGSRRESGVLLTVLGAS
jgi:hypothetical protein